MKFMLTFTWNPDADTRATEIERFQKTGGVPPQGVKLLGRWTRADLEEQQLGEALQNAMR
jgi:hypothetical protein